MPVALTIGALLSGCTTTVAGAPPTTPNEECTISDPYVVFESALADGDTLAVGDRGWLQASSVDQVQVQDPSGAVELTEQSLVIDSCDPESVQRWVDVTGVAPGAAILTVDGAAPITVRVT